MEAEEALVLLIRSRPLINDAIAGFIFEAGELPQDPPLPCLGYYRVSTQRDRSHDGPSGRAVPRITIDVWGSTYEEAKRTASLLRRSIDGFRGQVGTVWIGQLALDNDLDDFDTESGRHRVIQDYKVDHQEEVA